MPVLLYGHVQQHGAILLLIDKVHMADIVLDDIELLQGGDQQQLQPQFLEQLQPEAGAVLGSAGEGLIDHHQIEAALGARRRRLTADQPVLQQDGGGQNGVGQLLLLPARFAAGVGVALLLAAILPVALDDVEQMPEAHIDHLLGPFCILTHLLDQRLHLFELLLRVEVVIQRVLDTLLEALLELADLHIRGGDTVDLDKGAHLIVQRMQRLVDEPDAGINLLFMLVELAAEQGHGADGVAVEHLLEAGLVAWQILLLQLPEYLLILPQCRQALVQLTGIVGKAVVEGAHGIEHLPLLLAPLLLQMLHPVVEFAAQQAGLVGQHVDAQARAGAILLIKLRQGRKAELALGGWHGSQQGLFFCQRTAVGLDLALLLPQAGQQAIALVPERLERLLGQGQLLLQRLQQIRALLQRLHLLLQSFDLLAEARPVELLKPQIEIGQSQRLMAQLIERSAALLLLLQLLPELVDLLLQLAVLLGQQLDLLLVAPAQHIATLVLQGVPIILLMA